jgi:kinesin family member 6/9
LRIWIKIMHNASQDTVYHECVSEIVRSVAQGYNGTVMVYGQTGAGKTYTMSGGTGNYKTRGCIPRSIQEIFAEVNSRPDQAYTIRLSYLEIYNEALYDLLSPSGVVTDGSNELQILEDSKGGISVKGLTLAVASTEEEAMNLFFEGETNRAIAEHMMNSSSSRSHCILTIYVESRSRVESADRVLSSKLNLVDLAGSERVTKTHSTGAILREAMYINKSLSFLEQCVNALSDRGRDHVPFRQSRLTHFLRYCVCVCARVCVCVCVRVRVYRHAHTTQGFIRGQQHDGDDRQHLGRGRAAGRDYFDLVVCDAHDESEERG